MAQLTHLHPGEPTTDFSWTHRRLTVDSPQTHHRLAIVRSYSIDLVSCSEIITEPILDRFTSPAGRTRPPPGGGRPNRKRRPSQPSASHRNRCPSSPCILHAISMYPLWHTLCIQGHLVPAGNRHMGQLTGRFPWSRDEPQRNAHLRLLPCCDGRPPPATRARPESNGEDGT